MDRRQRRPLRVFVSHTSELAEYPPEQPFVESACAGIRRVDAMPVTMVDIGARQDVPPEVCRREVLSCDVHVTVIGFRYGSPVPERSDGMSYTELEFDIATAAGLPRLAFLLDERSPLPPVLVDEDRRRVNRFRARVLEGPDRVVSVRVGDPGRLEAAVSQALVRLMRQGSREAEAGSRPWMLPALNGPVIERPGHVAALLGALTVPGAGRTDVVTALEGGGGFGKTTLAGAVCRHPEVQARFPGGMLWVTIGDRMRDADLAATIGELCSVLSGGDAPATAEPMLAGGRLGELLDVGEPKLLVLDDVWRPEQLAPFLVGGASCRRLVTTRNTGVVPRGSHVVVITPMTANEAEATLTAGLEDLSPDRLGRLLSATGRWPVLLGLVNAAMADKVQLGATVQQAADWALGRLRAVGPTAFDMDDAGSRNLTVAATVGASLDLLSTTDRDRYRELAVFPAELDIPESAVALLWHATAGLSGPAADRLRARLARLRLVDARWSGRSPTVRLHGVLRSYLRHQGSPEQLARWNRLFVEEARRLASGTGGAASAEPTRWWLLPADAGYLWRMLPHHLHDGGMDDELVELLCNLRWVTSKIARTGSSAAAEADLDLVDTPTAHALRRALGQASHVLAPMEPSGALAATLASRLGDVPELGTLVADLRADFPRPQLLPFWPLPDRPPAALQRTFSGHDGAVYGCAFSPDGTSLASVGGDRTVRIWDLATGRSAAVLAGHADRVYGCAYSPDGTLLATTGEDRTARLWDVASESMRATLRGHTDGVYNCTFSPDGSLLATTGDDQTARIWDVATGALREVMTCHDDYVGSCVFTAEGPLLAGIEEDRQVRICDRSSPRGRLVSVGGTDRIDACALSPDGSVLASAGSDGTLRLSDVATGAMRQELAGHRERVVSCTFSLDGRMLASAGDDLTVRLWRTGSGETIGVLSGHTDRVYNCTFSRDGELLASASGDGTVRLWDVRTARGQTAPAAHTDRVDACAFSPDGAMVASASWDRTARLWSLADHRCLHVLSGHVDRVSDCSFSPDGRVLATAGWDGLVTTWDTALGVRRVTLTGHDGRVYSCAFSGTGDLLATAGGDGAIRLWQADTGASGRRLAGHVGPVHRCAFGRDGSVLASVGVDGTVRLWDVHSGDTRDVLAGHKGWVYDCALSPDGRLVASAGVDATVRLWDVESGQPVHVLRGHREWVHGCSFSPDGGLLMTVGSDGTARVWQPRTGRCLCALRVADRLLDCAWHPDGDRVCAAGVRGLYVLTCQT